VSGIAPSAADRGKAIVGVLGILTGITVAGVLVTSIFTPQPSALNAYSTYLSNVNLYWAGFILALASAVVGIPFFAGVGRMLSDRSTLVAPGATLVMIAGIVIAVLGGIVSTGAFWAISQGPTGSMYQSNAVFEGAFWDNFSFILTIFGFALAGLGFILFGWLAWRSNIVPNWAAIVAYIGGVAGFLVGVTIFSFIVTLIAFIIWGFVIGARLLVGHEGTNLGSTAAG
jgi:hypothetical protein